MIGFCSEQGVIDREGNIVSELFPNDAQARIDEMESDGDFLSGTVRFYGAR